jgi:hypothetical protein
MGKVSRLVGVLAAAALLACGGGGGDDDALHLSFSTNPLFRHVFMDELATFRVSLTGTVNPLPTGDTYVGISDSSGLFDGFEITTDGTSQFGATLRVRANATPGSHTGTLHIQLCKDPSCASQYKVSPSTLPYEVRVLPIVQGLPAPDLAFKVAGADVVVPPPTLDAQGQWTYAVAARFGQTVEFTPATGVLIRASTSPNGIPLSTSRQPNGQIGFVATMVSSGTVSLFARLEDARKIAIQVTVTP